MPGPRGGTWSPSAIAGDRRAQNGILCQELYVGVRVFNRRKFRKHPDTCRRSSVRELERKLTRAKDMYLNGVVDMPELESLAGGLKARKAELETKLASVETPSKVVPHPGLAEVYQRLSARLQEALEGDDGEEVRTELRNLIDRVDFQPLEGLGKFDLKVSGKLKALLGVSERAAASSQCEVLVGAGTGFEPVTFRL